MLSRRRRRGGHNRFGPRRLRRRRVLAVQTGRHMSTTGNTNITLVDAARLGDRQALQALLAEHLPLIYNIIGRALEGHADVDDVVQETMLRVVRGLPRLRDPSRFRSWLVAIHQQMAGPLEMPAEKRDSEEFFLCGETKLEG